MPATMQRADGAAGAQGVMVYVKPSEVVDRQRHKDVRCNRETRERTGADFVHKSRPAMTAKAPTMPPNGAPQTAYLTVPRRRERARLAQRQDREQSDDRQKGNQTRQPRVGHRIAQHAIHRRSPRLKRARDEDDRI